MLRPNQYFQCLGLISICFVYASQRVQGRFEIWKQVFTHVVQVYVKETHDINSLLTLLKIVEASQHKRQTETNKSLSRFVDN